MAFQNQNKGTVILTWNRASCEEGISHYRIYLNGKVFANTSSDINTYKADNMPFFTNLTFYVLAVTKACRVSGKTNEASIILTSTNKEISLNCTLNFFI